MDYEKAIWWTLYAVTAVLAIIAIVFATLAYCDSQSSQPHRNITRDDITAKGDLCVDGNANFGSGVAMDETLVVLGRTTLRDTTSRTLSLLPIQTINSFGTFQLTNAYSSYRIDTAGIHAIVLILPPVSSAPGQLFQVAIAQVGASNTVTFEVSAGDQFCNGACTTTNPVFTMPGTAGNADCAIFMNDSVNSWFVRT